MSTIKFPVTFCNFTDVILIPNCGNKFVHFDVLLPSFDHTSTLLWNISRCIVSCIGSGKMETPSCNAFVVIPPLSRDGSVIFGKNSDRPQGEVQELIYEPPKEYSAGETLKCTYVEVDQVEKTNGVILSKPAWMWGCEMGANDQNVVIGSAAVKTKVKYNEKKQGLLGNDLVRLALERCKTSKEGVDIITKLLAQYGQNTDIAEGPLYCSSFILVDVKETWILETVDVHWVAQKVTTPFRNISNCFTIKEEFDLSSPNVKDFAKENGLWNGDGDFNFAATYSEDNIETSKKYMKGYELLKEVSDNNFTINNMFNILRNSEICSAAEDSFATAGSQVSLLLNNKPCCHWFTATPDPRLSVFKPFIFTPDVKLSLHTKSPVPNDLANVETGFDRRHNLYKLHSTACSNNKVVSLLQEMEQSCAKEVEKFLEDFQPGQSLVDVDELLKDAVETEVKFYK